ncbi:MAG: nucleoside kinase, partial [Sphaerochaeta sp.]|nr:nucleoside kinase [Sphaerochaeta sp.]
MREIAVTINDQTLTVGIGSSVEDVMRKAGIIDYNRSASYAENPYIGALVNCEFHSSSRALVADCTLSPVRLFSDMGTRMYRHSICYLLCAAVSMLYPARRLIIGHALGDGYYFRFDDELTLNKEDIVSIEQTMRA